MRKERGITQEDFATDSGFDRGYISGVERGVRNPSVLVLSRMADALNVDAVEGGRVREEPTISRQDG